MKRIAEYEPPNPAEIRTALGQILASREFRASHRCQALLRYVVEASLRGQAETLKERTIGIEAFGRPTAYEPSDDASVRVTASEVRRRLAAHYGAGGEGYAIRILLPVGSYMPRFVRLPAPTATPAAGQPGEPPPPGATSEPAAAPSAPRRRRRWAWALAGATAGVVLLAVFALRRRPPVAATPLQAFWAPILSSSSPVLVGGAYVPVYGPKALTSTPVHHLRDLILLPDQFVGGGDLIAAARVTALLARFHHPFRLEMGSQINFGDLRAGPAVLLGYAYTQWREIASGFRYFIATARTPFGITDRGRPTAWNLPRLGANRHTNLDYAIVSRVWDPDTRAMLLEVAGITQYGTAGAAEFVTSAGQLDAALRHAPAGWRRENLQLVLRVRVIAGAPARVRVVAAYYWPSGQ